VTALVTAIAGEPRSVEAEPGGKRGLRVTVALADATHREAVEAALAKFLFEAVVTAG
jgi:hypothetical protein